VGIIDFTIACSFEESVEYCTYDNPLCQNNELIGYSLMLIVSRYAEESKTQSFGLVENLIERVISHETIHVVIKKLENQETSDKLDDFELLYPVGMGKPRLIKMNFLGYANDNTGLVVI
jgi:hypothetical protein